MLIPKSKMPILINAIEILQSLDEDQPEEEKELLKQIHDKCSLCQHGDATFLEIEVSYVTNRKLYEHTKEEIQNILDRRRYDKIHRQIRDRSAVKDSGL